MTFSPSELARYGRHLVLPEVGMQGQARLRESSVLLVGAGGLGSPLGVYLAAAGVGRIGLVEFDKVELSNLQRQVLYATSDVGRPKLEAAAERLRGINPHAEIEPHPTRLDAGNAREILARYDVVVDGTDNFPTRYLVNDASLFHKVPVVHGSIFRFDGQVTTFMPHVGPCYRCLYPEPPPAHLAPSCAEAGVLGILPGIIGTLQATEAIKLILGRGEPLIGRLLTYDSMEMTFRTLKLRRDKACPACGENPSIREYIDYEGFCEGPPQRD
jgi:sulfur-carrier protein adenylyltransferase/sulfurtransferase